MCRQHICNSGEPEEGGAVETGTAVVVFALRIKSACYILEDPEVTYFTFHPPGERVYISGRYKYLSVVLRFH